jgi:hypothetical protein
VHKKAVEKAAREAAKQQHINQHAAVAQEALAAAAWLGGGRTPGGGGGGYGQHKPAPQQQQQQQQQSRQPSGQQRQQRGRQPGNAVASREEQLTHEQVLAAAKQDNGPLSIDGELRNSLSGCALACQPRPTSSVWPNAATIGAACCRVAEAQGNLATPNPGGSELLAVVHGCTIHSSTCMRVVCACCKHPVVLSY